MSSKSKFICIILGSIIILVCFSFYRSSTSQCLYAEKENAKFNCWVKIARGYVETKDMDEALSLTEQFYIKEPGFPRACHRFMHELGVMAYDSMGDNNFVDIINEQTGYCHYGFYHGYISKMIEDKYMDIEDNLGIIRDFCDLLLNRVDELGTLSVSQCYHGIGHGIMHAIVHHDNTRDITSLAKESLQKCDNLTDNKNYLASCYSAVFHTITHLYLEDVNGFYADQVDLGNPFTFCDNFEQKYQNSCYPNIIIIANNIFTYNFSQIATLIEGIKYLEGSKKAIFTLGTNQIHQNPTHSNINDILRNCRSISNQLQISCIQGIGVGFIFYGIPGHGYQKAIAFCTDDILSEDEQKACLDNIFYQMKVEYSVTKFNDICSKYKNICRN